MLRKIVACVLSVGIIFTVAGFSRAEYLKSCIYLDDCETSAEIDQEALYEELFDPNSVVKIDINISRSELAKIQQDYEDYKAIGSKSPIYRRAESVTFEINGNKYVIEDVGIRMKGNSSRCNFYNDVLGIYNLVNFKLSFNETFDKAKYYADDAEEWENTADRQARKNRTFATLEKLEVKWNKTMDNTYVRNVYANDMFRDYGVLAQKCNIASFGIRGNTLGIYRIYEPVDDIFIERYLPEQDWGGDLYKCNGSTKLPLLDFSLKVTYGVSDRDTAKFYNFDLKTNKESSNHAALKNLLETLSQENLTKEQLESVVDMDYFLRFCALDYVMGNMDNLRYNYNNAYIYFRPSDGKAMLIPYDFDFCLGSMYSWQPFNDEAPLMSPLKMTEISPYVDKSLGVYTYQRNPLFRLTVTEDGFYKDEYTAYLLDIVDSDWWTEENYRKYYETARRNYSDEIVSKFRYCSTWDYNLEFTMEGGDKSGGNMAVGEFMSRIKQTVYEYAGE